MLYKSVPLNKNVKVQRDPGSKIAIVSRKHYKTIFFGYKVYEILTPFEKYCRI